MFTKLYNQMRALAARHIPHCHLYRALAALSVCGCLGLDKTLYGAVAAALYLLLAKQG